MPRGAPGGLLLAVGLAAAAPAGAAAKAQPISRAENRIVFAGDVPGADREYHLRRPFKASHYAYELHAAQWSAGTRRAPVLTLFLVRLPPGRHFSAEAEKGLEDAAKFQRWTRGLAFAAAGSGTADTALGPAPYLIFTAGGHRCAVFRQYLNESRDPDRLDDMRLTGIYCPPTGALDPAALAAVLARIAIRGIAAPQPEAPRADDLAALVTAGDLEGLRRIAGPDPDAAIAFSHPRFAGGRTIRRPMVVAAALFGRKAVAAWLIARGASLAGRGSGAICAAIAEGHEDIVALLLAKNPALARYRRCGRDRNLAANALARLLGHDAIARRLEGWPR